MATRQTLRLVVAVAAPAFFVVLLFIGPITAASPGGDRSRPTAPTNLVVTGRTETTISLNWNGSQTTPADSHIGFA